MWPGYALRAMALFAFVAAVLFLMGGLIQINPIWLWGPDHTYLGTNGAQPDRYLGWLIGALRIMPNLEISIAGHTLIPNPSSAAYRGPCSQPLSRCPGSTAASSPTTTKATTCSTDRATTLDVRRWPPPSCPTSSSSSSPGPPRPPLPLLWGDGYQGAIWFFRGAFFLLPVIVFFVTRRICRDLKRTERHPLREWSGSIVTRNPRGGYNPIEDPAETPPHLDGSAPSKP